MPRLKHAQEAADMVVDGHVPEAVVRAAEVGGGRQGLRKKKREGMVITARPVALQPCFFYLSP